MTGSSLITGEHGKLSSFAYQALWSNPYGRGIYCGGLPHLSPGHEEKEVVVLDEAFKPRNL